MTIPRKRNLRVAALASIVVSVVMTALPPASATSAGAMTVKALRRGDLIDVRGRVELDKDGPLIQVMSDPKGDYSVLDQNIPISQDGGDLTAVRLRTLRTGELLMQWQVAELPEGPDGPGLPGLVYVLDFRVDFGAPYVLAVSRSSSGDGGTRPVGWLCRHAMPNSVPAGESSCDPWMYKVRSGIPAYFNAANDTISAVLSPLDLGLRPGSTISRWDQGRLVVESCGATLQDIAAHLANGRSCSPPCHGACVSPGDVNYGWPGRIGDVEVRLGDETIFQSPQGTWRDRGPSTQLAQYTYGLSVRLAVGRPGADPKRLSYDRPAAVDQKGDGATFAYLTRGIRGGQAIFARACLGGSSECIYARSKPLPPGPGELARGRPQCFGLAESDGVIVGTHRSERLVGTTGADIICAGGGNDRIFGGSGNDVVVGGRGRDRILGGDGSDQLMGEGGGDALLGGRGFDSCAGGPARDRIRGCEYES